MRACLVDDEPLALKRLARLLKATGRIDVAASLTDPEVALDFLSRESVDVLFLDIQMPGMNGFELLARLPSQPTVVFTTAFDQYALEAFRVNSIDYLLKPVESAELDRALDKLGRLRGRESPPDVRKAIEELAATMSARRSGSLERIAFRVGERVQFVELRKITHFFAKDKLTYAAAEARDYVVDHTIAELEKKLSPTIWVRIHRSTLLNVDYIDEITPWFGSGLRVRLKDAKHTELTVARDRARMLKDKLGF